MASTKDAMQAMMKTLTFGVEIETKGLGHEQAARVIAAALGGTASGYMTRWAISLADGRRWTVVRDGSLTGVACEVVSPICTWADIEAVQQVVRALRAAGARVDAQCGLHVHVGAQKFDAAALGRLARFVYSQEDLLIQMTGTQSRTDDRYHTYCGRVDQAFIDRLPRCPSAQESVLAAWYGSRETMERARSVHYHGSRYRGLNLHAVSQHGTVEFRYFAGTMHAGEVKSAIQLCLAIASKALLARSAVTRKRQVSHNSPKYAARTLLIQLAMIGDDFATARLHLLKRMRGDASSAGTGRPRGGVPTAQAVQS